jgi:hypothetical protein
MLPRPISFSARSISALPTITFRDDHATATPELSELFSTTRHPHALIVRRIYGNTYAIEVNRLHGTSHGTPRPISVVVARWSPLENRWLRSMLFRPRQFDTMAAAARYVNRAVANYAARERTIADNRWRDADQVAGEPPMRDPRTAVTTRCALCNLAQPAIASSLRAPRCPVCATAVATHGDLCAACRDAGRNAANGEL